MKLDDSEPGYTVAFLLTNPGAGPVNSRDRRWATLLTRSAQRYGVPIEPIHRAHDQSLDLVDADLRAA
jgi:hypothetical protein